MSRQKIGLLISGVAIALLFAWVIMTRGPLAPIKVTIEKIQVGEISNSVFGVGTVKARHSYNLAPTLTGRVKSVRVDQGDSVTAGQLLLEMDPVDLDEKLNASRQNIEKAANAIQALSAQLSETQSRLVTLSATLKRYQELRSGGFVSQEMLDAKLHEKNAATAALASASANLATAHADHLRSQSEMRGIEKLQLQTRLTSPINGIVVARLIEPGSTVISGQLALQVVDPHKLWIETRITQKQAGQLRTGQAAEIVLRSQPHATIIGKVARVDLISDAVTEERIVNVSFDAADQIASIGEYAEVTISLPGLNHARTISSAAVKRIAKQSGVWILRDDKPLFKPVKTGVSTIEGRTEILDGIADEDSVIVYSQQPLRVDLKVKVVSELVRG